MPFYNVDRQISELLGVAKGIICDGIVNDAETIALKQWIAANPDVVVSFPGNVISARVFSMLQDGVIDEDERAELKDLLMDLAGEPENLTGSMVEPTRLPLDVPPPAVAYSGREFVFTGLFAFGQRVECEHEVRVRGGRCGKSVTMRTDTLVIGSIASPDWAHSSYGRKIEQAMAMKETGHRIQVIDEVHWTRSLEGHTNAQ